MAEGLFAPSQALTLIWYWPGCRPPITYRPSGPVLARAKDRWLTAVTQAPSAGAPATERTTPEMKPECRTVRAAEVPVARAMAVSSLVGADRPGAVAVLPAAA